jgi:hypothetical protein
MIPLDMFSVSNLHITQHHAGPCITPDGTDYRHVYIVIADVRSNWNTALFDTG